MLGSLRSFGPVTRPLDIHTDWSWRLQIGEETAGTSPKGRSCKYKQQIPPGFVDEKYRWPGFLKSCRETKRARSAVHHFSPRDPNAWSFDAGSQL